MRLGNWLAILLVFGLLGASVEAVISAAEAVEFIEVDNSFLKKNDRVETPNVLIKHDAKKYWMVPLLSGEDAVSFFPVSFSEKTLSNNAAINSQLFSVAKFLRDYLNYRNLAAQQSKRWFIGRDNALIIGELSNDLESEVVQLNIVKSNLSASSSVSKITAMQESLNTMAALSGDLSQKISAAVDGEAVFTTEPSSSNLESISSSFNEAFLVLFDLEEEARSYQDLVFNLKNVIANDSALSDSQKTQYVALADAPRSLYTIGSTSIGDWVIASQESQQKISQLLNGAKSKVFLDSAALALENRVKRNNAFTAIFGADSIFTQKTGYPSLKLALDDLQSVTKRDYWKNQEQLAIAIEQYGTATRMFDNENFDLSLVASQKAKRAVELVKKDGLIEEEPTDFDPAMLISVLVIVLILIIVVYFLRNRRKILGTVLSKEGPQEVDIYDWQKK